MNGNDYSVQSTEYGVRSTYAGSDTTVNLTQKETRPDAKKKQSTVALWLFTASVETFRSLPSLNCTLHSTE